MVFRSKKIDEKEIQVFIFTNFIIIIDTFHTTTRDLSTIWAYESFKESIKNLLTSYGINFFLEPTIILDIENDRASISRMIA